MNDHCINIKSLHFVENKFYAMYLLIYKLSYISIESHAAQKHFRKISEMFLCCMGNFALKKKKHFMCFHLGARFWAHFISEMLLTFSPR